MDGAAALEHHVASQAFSLSSKGESVSRDGGDRRRSSHRSSRRSSHRSSEKPRSSFANLPLRASLLKAKKEVAEEDDESGPSSVYSGDSSSHETESILTGRESSTHQTYNIAAKETYQVQAWRTVMSLMLLATAGAVIGTTHLFLKRNEENEFESAFKQAATTITDSMRLNFVKLADSLNSRAESVTAMTVTSSFPSSYSWPFVTIPHFEIRGQRARAESRSELFGFSVLVDAEQKATWESYSVENQGWVFEGRGIDVDSETNRQFLPTTPVIPREITKAVERTTTAVSNNATTTETILEPYQEDEVIRPFLVNWQMSPVPALTYTINLDLRSTNIFGLLIDRMIETKESVMSDFTDLEELYETILPPEEHKKLHQEFSGTSEGRYFPVKNRPHSIMMSPIFDSFVDNVLVGNETLQPSANLVGAFYSIVPWDWQVADLLPQETEMVHGVLDNNCGTTFTYEIRGPDVTLIGINEKVHEVEYEGKVISKAFASLPIVLSESESATGTSAKTCEYTIRVYPTKRMKYSHESSEPEYFSVVMAGIFIVVFVVFLIFVRYVQNRQDMVMATAIRTSAIVSSLFPANVRDRIMRDAEQQGRMDAGKNKGLMRLRADQVSDPKSKLEIFLDDDNKGTDGGFGEDGHDAFKNKPIADLFPEATVLFADLVGFTAWSSEREPTQVFQLLETLYAAYDAVARRRRVFKVETIGDCYVAVTGLPEPRKDHAVVMARFATDCMRRMKVLVKKLAVPLGPGTADLSMRFGLHSGPVTAGVLRGEKSRFQLFGDTVNTAARMESNGAKEKIHVSEETAEKIKLAKKAHWLTEREDKIHAKGKGELQTFWLKIKKNKDATATSGSDEDETSDYDESSDGSDEDEDGESSVVGGDVDGEIVLDERSQLLVDWTVDQLARLLKQILARRRLLGIELSEGIAKMQMLDFSEGGTVIDEVKDIVDLAPFDPRATKLDSMAETVTLPPEVMTQLREYVATIATLHNDNQFHNLSHATHVTMSVVKLLSRIVSADDAGYEKQRRERAASVNGDDISEVSEFDPNDYERYLHERSYGVRSDPLAQFAIVFSALIHDVDHPGVTNAQLINENAKVAETYSNKTISEQNSVDLAWYLFMDGDRYADLRGCIYHDEKELYRFRQLVVNAVIATDIADKDLKFLRNSRWENAFSERHAGVEQESINRKATVMIDCLLQASDIAHTMQHWHIYRKWNEMLFRELYVAHLSGRADKSPEEFWYDGEIGFFDFYIIPLAKKLKDCGVFGVSSEEYLNYAVKNRNEWVSKGKAIVEEYMSTVKDLKPNNKAEKEGSDDESEKNLK